MSTGTIVMVIAFIVFTILGFAMFPFMIKVFIALQTKIGNQNLWLVKFLREHEWQVVIGVWIMLAVGLTLAIPAMIKDGFFTPTP